MIKVHNDPRVDKFIRDLSEKDSSRIVGVINLFSQIGFSLSQPHIKKISGDLWELRTGDWRILFGMVDGEGVVVNMFLKKSQKTPLKEIELAKRRLREYQ